MVLMWNEWNGAKVTHLWGTYRSKNESSKVGGGCRGSSLESSLESSNATMSCDPV